MAFGSRFSSLPNRNNYTLFNKSMMANSFQSRQDMLQKLLSNVADDISCSSGSSGANDRLNSLIRQRSWSNTEAFIEDNMHEVYDKLPNLEKQIWGKLIVMESGRRTAKAYLRHPVITVDGSDTEFDGLRIGLARFDNMDRLPIVREIYDEIQQGVKIKVDPDGNVWAKRMCFSPVFLKPLYRNRPNDLFVIDQRPVKVFDIKRFKEILVQELQLPRPDRRRLEKCCLICLKFSVDHFDLMRTPCWVLIVHLVAIELLNLVLPKENDFSTPSSSFVAANSPLPRSISPETPPGGYNGNLHRNNNNRLTRGGVFKRIAKKDEISAISGGQRFPIFSSNNQYGSQNSYDHWGSQPSLQQQRQRMTTSMLDLRQLSRYHSPPYFDRSNPGRVSNRGGSGHQMGHGQRVGSFEHINEQPRFNALPRVSASGQYIPQENRFLGNRGFMQKWKSQDSGLGSGGGSIF